MYRVPYQVSIQYTVKKLKGKALEHATVAVECSTFWKKSRPIEGTVGHFLEVHPLNLLETNQVSTLIQN